MKNKNKINKVNLLIAALSISTNLAPTIQAVHASTEPDKGKNNLSHELEIDEEVLLEVKAIDDESYNKLKNLTDSEMNNLRKAMMTVESELTEEEKEQVEIIEDNIVEDIIYPEDEDVKEVDSNQTDEDKTESEEEEYSEDEIPSGNDETVNEIEKEVEEDTSTLNVEEVGILEKSSVNESYEDKIEREMYYNNQSKSSSRSIKFTRNATSQEFIDEISKHAIEIAEENDLYASVIVAQAALETGFGKSTLSLAPNFNIFGIKGSYNGESAHMRTMEDDGSGNLYQITAGFKKYPSYMESLQDYANLMVNGTSWDSSYYQGTWKSNTSSYKEATNFLMGKYATDTSYADKLNKIIEAYDLQELDDGIYETTVATKTHDVISGDTLSKISNMYDVTVDEIVKLNDIENKNLILVGDILVIKEERVVRPSSSLGTIEKVGEAFSEQGVLPVDKGMYKVTSKFGSRKDPITGSESSFHYGTDIAQSGINGKNILSVLPGKVTFTGNENNGYGNYIVIDHGGFTTLYAHMGSVSQLEKGTNVEAGTVIGRVGSTGRSTGPHLHIELEINGNKVDPEIYLDLIKNKAKPVTPSTNPEEVSPEVTKDQEVVYQIKRGDTLYKIALENKTSVKELKILNNLTSDLIIVGRTLNIPTEKSSVVGKEYNENIHNVKYGDTLWKIATENNTTVNRLKDLNSLKSSLIVIGQKLVIK